MTKLKIILTKKNFGLLIRYQFRNYLRIIETNLKIKIF